MLLNKLLPFAMDAAPPGVSGEGVGGARKRMKKPNFSMSLIASRAAGAVVSVMLFGSVANRQLGVSSRSVWNSSLVVPCSTLYASAEKRDSDLLCAFHPNRVILTSLSLLLLMPMT